MTDPENSIRSLRPLKELLFSLKPHDHLCLIYESAEEWAETIVPFIVAGLERNEKCIYVIDARTADQIRSVFKNAGHDLEEFEKSGRFTILHEREAYTINGFFDPDLMIELLIAETEKAVQEGFTALRMTGEMSWALRGYAGSDRILEYEARLNRELFPLYPCVAICQYDRWKFEPDTIKGVVLTHPLLVSGGRVYHNFYYIKPEEYLNHKKSEREVQHWLNNLERERKNQVSLQESERRYRTLFNQSVTGVYLHDFEGRILDVNREACRQVGYSCEELLKMSIFDLHADTKNTVNMTKEEILKSWSQWQTGHNFTIEAEHRHKNGTVFPVQLTTGVVDFGTDKVILADVIDITEHKKAIKDLQNSEEKHRRLFETMAQGIIYQSADGTIISANPAAERILGLNYDQMQGKTSMDPHWQMIEEDGSAVDGSEHPAMIALRTGQKVGPVIRGIYHPGEKTHVWLTINAIPLFQPGESKPFQVYATIEDITWRKNILREVNRRNDEMEALLKVSTALRLVDTLEALPPLLLDQTLDVLETDTGGFWIHNPSSDRLLFAAARGWYSKLDKSYWLPGESLVGKVFSSGRMILSKDIVNDSNLAPELIAQIPGDWSELIMPVKTGDLNIGVVAVAKPLSNEFVEEEIRLLNSLSEIAGIAIHRLNLHQETQKRLKQLQSLNAIDKAINTSQDLCLILGVLLDQIISMLEVDAAAIFLLNPHQHLLEYKNGRGFRLTESIEHIKLKPGESVIGKAALQRSITTFDAATEKACDSLPKQLCKEAFHSCVSVPLVAKGETRGVIALFHRQPFSPDKDWLTFASSLAEQGAIAVDNTRLFTGLQQANQDLSLAYDATLEGWARALDMRDHETEGHSRRVMEMTVHLAILSGIPEKELIHIRRGCLLHDIGKVGIPDSILHKPGKLNAQEWEIMTRHPQMAYELLHPIAYLHHALDIPYCHHEKYDGSGYPRGLKKDEIPLAARIFAIVDVFDALTSNRPYRPAWSREEALEYIRKESGKHFDPIITELFLTEIEKEQGLP